jgi:hypothetical protein
MRLIVNRCHGPAILTTPTVSCPLTTGAAMAAMPGAKTSSIIAYPRFRAACNISKSACTVVVALGPYSLGCPKPCRLTNSSDRSSLKVNNHAWPDAELKALWHEHGQYVIDQNLREFGKEPFIAQIARYEGWPPFKKT